MVKRKKKGTQSPPKPDTTINTERKEKLERFLEEKLPGCEETWKNLKEVLQNATKHVFGKKKRKSEDWFDDQDNEIQRFLKDKKLSWDKEALREEIRKLKIKWFQQKADEAERYTREKNHREFYAMLNTVYGSKSKSIHPVRTKSGDLLSSPDDIKERWVEHFNELLNQPTDVDWDILDEVEEHPTIEELDEPITMEEVDIAIKNTKLRKSQGPDGIIPEVLVYGGNVCDLFCLPSTINSG